jgi:hypothetical protein
LIIATAPAAVKLNALATDRRTINSAPAAMITRTPARTETRRTENAEELSLLLLANVGVL